jgi:hypothetical protein
MVGGATWWPGQHAAQPVSTLLEEAKVIPSQNTLGTLKPRVLFFELFPCQNPSLHGS